MPNSILNITFNEPIPQGGYLSFVYGNSTILYDYVRIRGGSGQVTANPSIIKTAYNFYEAVRADYPSEFVVTWNGNNKVTIKSNNPSIGFRDGISGNDVTFGYVGTGIELSANRKRVCKGLLGGIRAAFLAPYKKVYRSEINYDGVSLFEFPETNVYKFDLVSGDVFEQKHNENEGGKYYEINLTLTFNKITAFDNTQFQRMLKKDYFIILQDNNGNFFLSGFRNGLTAEKLDRSITQYKIDFVGMEEEMAPFVNDIMYEDFIVVDGNVNYIFQDDTDFIFQDDTNYIFQ